MVQKVFIPQEVNRYEEDGECWVPVFDLSPAAKYGELTVILGHGDHRFLAQATKKISQALEEFGPDDFLLAVGDPSVIAVCAGIILRRLPKMKMLKWDRKMKVYVQMEIKP